MGAFFTNIQLNTLGIDKTILLDSVIEYVTLFNLEAGYVLVENSDEADKTVIISELDNSNWLSIYDEEFEDQGSKKLNKFSSNLSKHFNTSALSILVNDSDYMYVGLNINGKLKDTISNLSKEIDFNKSKPNVWSNILLENYSFEDIVKAWRNKSVFVEEFLRVFAKFINIDSSKLLTGYEYLSEENPGAGIKLNFAQKDKKKAAKLGLTKFSMLAGVILVDVKPAEKQEQEWMLTNYGLDSIGMDIVIAGKCIEDGLLLPEKAKASYLKYKSEKQNEFTVPFIETVSTTGEKIFYARMEDIFIPKGFKPTYPMTAKEAKRYGKIVYDSVIKFNISFIGGEEGKGEFNIWFSPLINRQDGSYYAPLIKGQLEDWQKKNGV